MKTNLLSLLVIALFLVNCTSAPKDEKTLSGLDRAKFQTVLNGDSTDLYVLKNASGMEVAITNFGGRIVSVMVPDKTGKMIDVVLGFDSIADYINVPSDFGATIGRYANRSITIPAMPAATIANISAGTKDIWSIVVAKKPAYAPSI